MSVRNRYSVLYFLQDGFCIPRKTLTSNTFEGAFYGARKHWFEAPRDRVEIPVSVMLTQNNGECRVMQWKDLTNV